jgi:5'-3' exonuclease
MDVYLIDGTYELFRFFHALPPAKDADGREVGAVRGVLRSVVGMLEKGTTHLGVATDHVIESFRNELYAGYKTGDGIDLALRSQFLPLEEGLRLLGITVWAMVREEADDALASAAGKAALDPAVGTVYICTPDKDLAQSVRNGRVVQLDRRTGTIRDEAGVRARFGVGPESIPDYLALVGDAADGFPGLRGWGAKSAAAVLARYTHLESIPREAVRWDVTLRGAAGLEDTLRRHWDDALLFREIATLRRELDVFAEVGDLRWRGPERDFEELCRKMRADELWTRVTSLVTSMEVRCENDSGRK